MVLSVQFPAALVGQIDDLLGRMREAQPGVKLSRADVIRSLLHEALAHRQGSEKPSK